MSAFSRHTKDGGGPGRDEGGGAGAGGRIIGDNTCPYAHLDPKHDEKHCTTSNPQCRWAIRHLGEEIFAKEDRLEREQKKTTGISPRSDVPPEVWKQLQERNFQRKLRQQIKERLSVKSEQFHELSRILTSLEKNLKMTIKSKPMSIKELEELFAVGDKAFEKFGKDETLEQFVTINKRKIIQISKNVSNREMTSDPNVFNELVGVWSKIYDVRRQISKIRAMLNKLGS